MQIIEKLQALQADYQCSILFISHHLGVIAELCDRVVVLYGGEVVEAGPVREIFHDPKHPYTRRLIECDPGHIKTRARTLPTIPGDVPDLADLPKGCIFRERCSEAICRAAQREASAFGTRPAPARTASCWLNRDGGSGMSALSGGR